MSMTGTDHSPMDTAKSVRDYDNDVYTRLNNANNDVWAMVLKVEDELRPTSPLCSQPTMNSTGFEHLQNGVEHATNTISHSAERDAWNESTYKQHAILAPHCLRESPVLNGMHTNVGLRSSSRTTHKDRGSKLRHSTSHCEVKFIQATSKRTRQICLPAVEQIDLCAEQVHLSRCKTVTLESSMTCQTYYVANESVETMSQADECMAEALI